MALHSMRFRYSRASTYSSLKPFEVRSPEITTTSGTSSFTSAIARSRCCGRKNCVPQWRSESCTIRNIARKATRSQGSERYREEALDHRVHLLGHLELVEVACADRDPELEVGLDLAQPEGVRVVEFGAEEQHRQG